MKKIRNLLFLCLAFILVLCFTGCGSDNKDSDKGTTDVHMNSIVGKVIEIKDINTILIEITKERGGYKIEDKVLINYKEFVLTDYEDPDCKKTVSKPELNDEVTLGFWPENVKQKDGYDYIEVKEVSKPINN